MIIGNRIYGYTGNEHGLCNAHLIREQALVVEEGQKWGQRVIDYLLVMNEEVQG
jgi:hypothetical protein